MPRARAARCLPLVTRLRARRVTGKLMHVIMGRMAKAAHFADDSEYAKRVRDPKNAEFYNYIRDRIVAKLRSPK